MRKILLLLLTLSLLSITARSQDFEFGTFKVEDLSMKKYNKDTSAHAVVLLEHGRAEIARTGDDDINLVYDYHVKIKIFDKTAFNEGNIEIPFYSEDGMTYEKVEDVKGITISSDENGSIVKTELDPAKIYTEKDSKHWSRLKFAMPALREGCLVEYKYKIITPYISTFHPWQFQSDIPKVYSEYDVHIPAFWNFNASIVGGLKLSKNFSEVERGCFSFHGANCDCSHFIYGMSDIPAFIIEDDMTAPRNFVSAIYYTLSDRTNLFGGGNIKIAKDWKDVDYDLKHAEYFGTQIKKTSLFKDKVAPIIAGKTDDIEKAKAIYAYIKKTIKWNEVNSYGSGDGIRNALNNHTGNAAEVNLSLVAALKAAGLNAEAVLLSTRENGFVNKLYPEISSFNYVIAKLDIGDKSFLLDATDPMLSFGLLPMRCLNDQGRVMSLDKPSYWIDMTSPERQISTVLLDLTLQPDGKIKGTMTHYSMGYEAYEKRKEIKKFNSVDEYVENMGEHSRFKILSSSVSNVDSLDEAVSEKYEIEVKEYDNMDHEHFKFNPYVIDRLEVNPFKLRDRTYPVDWGMPSVTRYTLIMHLPEQYTVETPPQKINLGLPNGGGDFITEFTTDSNTFSFSHVMEWKKPIYSPEEYPYLKEFMNKIILSEREDMMLKKKL